MIPPQHYTKRNSLNIREFLFLWINLLGGVLHSHSHGNGSTNHVVVALQRLRLRSGTTNK